MALTLTRITDATIEPLGLQQVKDHARIDTDIDDAWLDEAIKTARREAEAYTRRSFLTQVWELRLEAFPKVIELPRPPTISVDTINYIDTAGASQTLASSAYQSDTKSEPARILPAVGTTFPSTEQGRVNAVTITFTAGYGIGVAHVPSPILQAMMMTVTQLYDHREDYVVGTIVAKMPANSRWLLEKYQMPQV